MLLRGADLLAPDEFVHVLESETFNATLGRIDETRLQLLAKKAANYESCTNKCAAHLKQRIEDLRRDASCHDEKIASDYKERLKLWFDLCRIARKQQIWDICRVSARFCVLYDEQSFVARFLKHEQSFKSIFCRELMRNLAEAHFILGEVKR